MWPNRVSNPGPLTYDSGALSTALRGPATTTELNRRSAGPRSAVGSASDSRTRGPGFDTGSGHILSFLLPLIQEGQVSVVTGESICRSTS